MSHSITHWTTKKMKDLIIPIDAFYISDRENWHPKEIENGDGTVSLSSCESEGVTGVKEKGNLFVHSIDTYGEGSGTFFNDILIPALQQSTGTLEAVNIWEGCEIERITVRDGSFISEMIDIKTI